MNIVEKTLNPWGYRYCLIKIDHFKGWLEVFPLRNQKAKTPEQLPHDQGKNLSAKMIEEVCNFLEIGNTRTTPFNPNQMAFQKQVFVR